MRVLIESLIRKCVLSWRDLSSAPTLSSVEQTTAEATHRESLNMVILEGVCAKNNMFLK